MSTRVQSAISDLFFNMDHVEFRKLTKAKPPASPSDLQEAIEKDALKMQRWLQELGHLVSYEDLVNDFYERL